MLLEFHNFAVDVVRMKFGPIASLTPCAYTNHNKTIEFMFAGINMWARLRLILARAVRQGFK